MSGLAEGWLLPASWLSDSSHSAEVTGVRIALPCPSDQLILVAIDGAQWRAPRSARWVADAATLLQGFGDDIDWDRLVERACRLRGATPVLYLLRYLEDVLQCDVPNQAQRALRAGRQGYDALAYRAAGRSWSALQGRARTAAAVMRASRRAATEWSQPRSLPPTSSPSR